MNMVMRFELYSIPGASCLLQKTIEIPCIPPTGTSVVLMPGLKGTLASVTWDLIAATMYLYLNVGQVPDANWTLDQLAPLGWAVAREQVSMQ
jgi:hypothetical protein